MTSYKKNYTPIQQATVDQMKTTRQTDLEFSFPTLKETDFPSHEAYEKALREQYLALREKEYNLVVQREAVAAFNVSYGANKAAEDRKENWNAWDGYSANPAEAYTKRPTDSCFDQTYRIATECDGHVSPAWCCAISATSMTAQISDCMGYTGKDNLIQPKSRCLKDKNGKYILDKDGNKLVTPRNNPNAADSLNKFDSIPPEYRINYDNVATAPTLNDAVKNGIIQVGDEFSIKTGEGNGITTGCHAMVLADVQYAADGKTVTSYTLQGNNPPTLQVINPNDPNEIGPNAKSYAKRKVVCVTKTNQWIKDKDAAAIKGKSAEDLQQMIAQERDKTAQTIDRLHQAETTYVTNKNYQKPPAYHTTKIDKERKTYRSASPEAVGRTDGFGAQYNELAAPQPHTQELQDILNKERELAEREQKLAQTEQRIAREEEAQKRAEENFIKEHPAYAPLLAEQKENRYPPIFTPDPVTIPPESSSTDLEERRRRIAEREKALDDKEQIELANRNANLLTTSSDLANVQSAVSFPTDQQKATIEVHLEQQETALSDREKALEKREKELAKKEKAQEKAEEKHLKNHPENADKLNEFNAANPTPDAVTVPEQTQSQDYDDRQRSINDRQQALAAKEEELRQREALLNKKTTNLQNLTDGNQGEPVVHPIEPQQQPQQQQNDGEPVVRPVSAIDKTEQRAGFYGDYFDLNVNLNNAIAQTTLENQKIAAQSHQLTEEKTLAATTPEKEENKSQLNPAVQAYILQNSGRA